MRRRWSALPQGRKTGCGQQAKHVGRVTSEESARILSMTREGAKNGWMEMVGVTNDESEMVGVREHGNVTLGVTNDESEMVGVRSQGNVAIAVVRG
jgi:hypothetical protein